MRLGVVSDKFGLSMNESQNRGFFARMFRKDGAPDRSELDDTGGLPDAPRQEEGMSDASRIARDSRLRNIEAHRAEKSLPQFSRAAGRDPDTARQAGRFNRLRDAFTPSHPIAHAQKFAGRRDLLGQLIHLIEDQQLHVVLYGDRGIGKTSILRIVANLARDAEYHVSYASCGSDTSFDSLFRQFARELSLLFHADYPPTHEDVEAGRTFADLMGAKDLTVADVTALFEKVQGTQVLLIVDEFDRVASLRMREQIAEVIKNLSDRGAPIQFFIAGVASNLTALVSHIPSIRRNLIGLPVSPLDKEETAQILEAGARQSGLAFEHEATDAIGVLSRGLPYLTQLLGLHASFNAAKRGADSVTREDVTFASGRAEEEIGLRLSEMGRRAAHTAGQQAGWGALRSLAEQAMIANGRLSEQETSVLDQRSRDLLLEPLDDGSDDGWQFREEATIPYIWLKTRDTEAA